MDVTAFQSPNRALEDLAARHHRRHRHVSTAQRLTDRHDVRLESPVLAGEPFAGTAQSSLDLIDHEQGAVPAAQLLRGLEVAGRRQRHQPSLDRLDDEGGDIARAQLGLKAGQISERNMGAAGQERAEALLEELVADDRERTERHAVKARVA